MAVTRNDNGTDRQVERPRSAQAHEMIEGLVILAILTALAAIARLPAG